MWGLGCGLSLGGDHFFGRVLWWAWCTRAMAPQRGPRLAKALPNLPPVQPTSLGEWSAETQERFGP